MLASAGIPQYEISNFARAASPSQNNQSRHNLKYWTRQPFLGFGVDAHSFLAVDDHQAIRFATPDSLDAYMNRAPLTVTPVSAQAAIEEYFFLGLRLNRGIDLANNAFREGHDFSRAINTAESTPVLPAHRGRFLQEGFWPTAVAVWGSAIQQCLHESLLQQHRTTPRLTR